MELVQAVFIAAAVVIRLGQMFWCVGATRSHSAAGAAGRLLIDFAVAALALWAIGGVWIPDLGETRLITFSHALGLSATSSVAMLAMVPLLLTTGTIAGAAQDRSRPLPMLVLTAVLAVLVIPLLLQVEFRLHGSLGASDLGIGLAAAAGGSAALVAAAIVRPRKSKFNRDLSANVLPSHNVPQQYFGVMLLLLGLSLYSGQPSLAVLGASAATLAGALFGKLMFQKVDTSLMLAASIAGIVSAGTMGGLTPTYAAVLAGLIGGAITPWLLMRIETQLRVDDAAGMVAGVLVGGVIGMLVTPLAESVAFATRLRDLGGNSIILVLALAAGAAAALAVCKVFHSAKSLRLTEDQEYEGVDLAEFDLNAYPDFQQTMIKSHHLRQL